MKRFWLSIQILLFAVLSGSYFAGADNLFGIALTILILESFPLNLLFGWIFFAYSDLTVYPILLFVFALVMIGLSYVQWFELVPRIVNYFKKPFAEHDRQIHLVVEKADSKLISDSTENWATSIAIDESPVERVIRQDR